MAKRFSKQRHGTRSLGRFAAAIITSRSATRRKLVKGLRKLAAVARARDMRGSGSASSSQAGQPLAATVSVSVLALHEPGTTSALDASPTAQQFAACWTSEMKNVLGQIPPPYTYARHHFAQNCIREGLTIGEGARLRKQNVKVGVLYP